MHIAVIGAGLSGLLAARNLQRAGHTVVVLDKGAGVGGRMATRRIGDAVLDHGAQFFTVRSDAFATEVNDWVSRDVVREWCRGFADIDGHPRYTGANGMTSIAKHLAGGLDVRLGVTVSKVTFKDQTQKWTVASRLRDSSTDELVADAIIVTAPLPQTIALLGDVARDLPRDLHDIDYDPTLCLLVTLKQQSRVSESGALQSPDDFFSFVCDNLRKGISATPSMTFHAEPGVSAKHYDKSESELHSILLERATSYFSVDDMIESHVKKWRYATPRRTFSSPYWTHPQLPLVLAGDAFDGPRIEGAALSGLAAASVFS
jgi:renalase